jgi:C-terminal processing protease CtpA/Prc
MKTMLQNCLMIGMLVILLSSSCTAVYPVVPTPTVTPAPTPTTTPPPPYKMLSPEDMRSDLDELFRLIEEIHPDPYMNRAKTDVDRDRQALYQELSQPMTIVDYYRKVAPLIDSLADPHTSVFPSSDTNQQISSYEKAFPLDVEFEDGKAYIIENWSGNPDISLGAELLSINGIPLSTIQKNIIANPGYYFTNRLWLLNGSSPEYQIALLPVGESIPVNFTIPGLTYNEIDKIAFASKASEDVTYRTLPNEKIGILTLHHIENIYEPVKQAFNQIQKDSVQDLIIDIRENGGGNDQSLDLFMKFLTDQPYQKCYKCVVQHPVDVQDRYHEKIYLLIGPYSFSAAVTLATILQDHRLGTLVGEETSETSSFCAYINSNGDPLPRTGLRYSVSSKCFIRPDGVVDGRGVIPDIMVKTTIHDIITGNDPVLDYTLDLIRNGGQMP